MVAGMFDSLAAGLAHTNASWDDLLYSLLPACALIDDSKDDIELQPLPDRLNEREQAAVLAVAHYLQVSAGNFSQQLVPFLCAHLLAIRHFTWQFHCGRSLPSLTVELAGCRAQQLPAFQYSYELVKRMVHCLGDNGAPEESARIAETISEFIKLNLADLRDGGTDVALVRAYPCFNGAVHALATVSWNWTSSAAFGALQQQLTSLAASNVVETSLAANIAMLQSEKDVPEVVAGMHEKVLRLTLLHRNAADVALFQIVQRTMLTSKEYVEFCQHFRAGHLVPHPSTNHADTKSLPWLKDLLSSTAIAGVQDDSGRVVELLKLACVAAQRRGLAAEMFHKLVDDLSVKSICWVPRVLMACICLISVFGQSDASLKSIACDALHSFLNSNKPFTSLSAEDSLQLEILPYSAAAFAVAQLLHGQKAAEIEAKMMHYINEIQSASTAARRRNLVTLLGHVAKRNPSDFVLQTVIPFLEQLLNDNINVEHSTLFIVVAEHLSELAVHDYACCVEVTSAFSSLFRGTKTTTGELSTRVKQELIKKQLAVINGCRNKELTMRRLNLNTQLSTFVQLCEKSWSWTESMSVQTMQELLWTVRLIEAAIALITAKEESLVSSVDLALFRNFWAFAQLVGTTATMQNSGALRNWLVGWEKPMGAIATRTPYLLVTRSTGLSVGSFAVTELNAQSSFPVVPLKPVLQALGQQLEAACGCKIPADLSTAELLFLLSVYRIAKLNVSTAVAGIAFIYDYCEELQDTALAGPVFAIADQINIELAARHAGDRGDKHSLAAHIQNVFLRMFSPGKHIISLVRRHLQHIRSSIAHATLLPETIELFFDCASALSDAYQDEVGAKAVYNYPIFANEKKVVLQIVRGRDERRRLLDELVGHIEGWVKKAADTCRSATQAILLNYMSKNCSVQHQRRSQFGVSLAMKCGISVDLESNGSSAGEFAAMWQKYAFYHGDVVGVKRAAHLNDTTPSTTIHLTQSLKDELKSMVHMSSKKHKIDAERVEQVLHRAAAVLAEQCDKSDDKLINVDVELVHLMCWAPVQIFTETTMQVAVHVWTWVMISRPQLELLMLHEFLDVWDWTIRRSRGIFSQKYNVGNIFGKKMMSGPSRVNKDLEVAHSYFKPHLMFIDFMSCHYAMLRGASKHHTALFSRFIQSTLQRRGQSSNHPLARLCYFKLWLLARSLVADTPQPDMRRHNLLKKKIYVQLLNILSLPLTWNGFDVKYVKMDIEALELIHACIHDDISASAIIRESSADVLTERIAEMELVAKIIVEQEYVRLLVWMDPTSDAYPRLPDRSFRSKNFYGKGFWTKFAPRVWNACPKLAIQLSTRIVSKSYNRALTAFVNKFSFYCLQFPEAIKQLASIETLAESRPNFKYLPYWAAVPPLLAISFFLPEYGTNTALLQYGLRSLDQFPVATVFFFVPQIVQALRYDRLGYAEQFILKTAKGAQLFAHQIIWNMNANMYKGDHGDASLVPDSLKQTLERIIEKIVRNLSGGDKEFYEREFIFFERVTGISGKLKPYIRRPKTEKKQKIDEELRLIKVDAGVYLPSNPESIVIDIDYASGRPLQSHAKAPFMATFKIKRAGMNGTTATLEKKQSSFESLYLQDDQDDEHAGEDDEEDDYAWQSAIFKVGDDCRQDLLSLQLISIFKNLFSSCGLDLYLFPYRVVATAPGCGIIEVVPNSISRDMMGRQNINDLYKWFTARFGDETTISYQKARDAFVKSLAAYSLMLYLLQIKDRHNGNVMIDGEGHVVHIDFGFIFDICPGGVKFELSPFKLTTEMIAILGNDINSEPYQLFVDLTVKAFIVARPYAQYILMMVSLMLGSSLPCFKPETMDNLRERFRLDLDDKDAAIYMKKLIRSSHRAMSTVVYDGFQKLTNGIPF